MANKLFIVGATSIICHQICSTLIKGGGSVYLASRDLEEQSRIAADLKLRHGIEVFEGKFEAEDTGSHDALVNDAVRKMGGIDCAIVASGELGDQIMARENVELSLRIVISNYVGPLIVLTHLANFMEKQGFGHIIVLSSVAGDRGRQSNYIYGSAKGGMTRFLQGLRNRLYQSGVHVLTVKLGFVDTRMTFGKSDMFLVSTPEKAARLVVKAIQRKADVVYVPFFWSFIMMIIRHIPEVIFKRLKL